MNDSSRSVMKFKSTASLIAPCGMDCGVCMAYVREKNKCAGCRGVNTYKPITRVKCKIKNCVTFRNSSAKYCFECGKFPCDVLKHLDKRYRTKYHMSMIENLETIKNFGIKKFLMNEDVRWTCARCGGTICVHRGYCSECGRKK